AHGFLVTAGVRTRIPGWRPFVPKNCGEYGVTHGGGIAAMGRASTGRAGDLPQAAPGHEGAAARVSVNSTARYGAVGRRPKSSPSMITSSAQTNSAARGQAGAGAALSAAVILGTRVGRVILRAPREAADE